MRCYFEPSPAGGFFVRLRGEPAPLSRHDTEEEAQAAAAAYDRGLARTDQATELDVLDDGSEVLVRQLRPEDAPRFVAGWSHPVHRRFLRTRRAVGEPAFFVELDHVDHEAIGAIADGTGVAVARYVRDADRPHMAEAAVTVVAAWRGRGLGGKLLRRLCARASENGIRVFTATLVASNDATRALLGEVAVRRRVGSAIEVDVELPVELPTLEHVLRSAAAHDLKRA